MSALSEHIRQWFTAHPELAATTPIVVAVSGGLDSMVLLRVLAEVVPHPKDRLIVAHFNHQLRGRSSQADARLVQDTAKRQGLVFVKGSPQERYNPKNGAVELWARRERHTFLANVCLTHQAAFLATGHQADDQLELLFLRLCRGEAASLGGMTDSAAAPFAPGVRLIRPLLGQTKAALAAAAEQLGVRYREDASNQDDCFRRNWLRHELLPKLTTEFGPATPANLLRCMAILSDESAYIVDQASDWLEHPHPAPFAELPMALQRRIVWLQLRRAQLLPEFDRIEALRRQPGRIVQFDQGVSVQLQANGQLVLPTSTPLPPFQPSAVEIQLTTAVKPIHFGDVAFSWKTGVLRKNAGLVPSVSGIERFDAAAVGGTIGLRFWRPGDRFQPSGYPKPAKLQDLFVSAKIPAAVRRRLVVATRADGEIFWVEGLRIAERFKLRPETRRYLAWQWRRAEPLLATPMGA